jgi:type IV pilus assembly protein PilM
VSINLDGKLGIGMLALLGSPKQTSMIGIDIGSVSVRILELGRSGDQYTVEAYAHSYLPESSVEGKNVKNTEEVAELIKQTLNKARIKTKAVAIAVPDSSVITKVVQLEDGLTDDEAEELVLLEADKYIPYPIDEVSIDYQLLGPSSRGGTLSDVLVVASRTENVNSRVDLMKQSGLEVKFVDVESYAIERVCHIFTKQLVKEGENATIAIFDIGEMYTQLTVLHNMKTAFSREDVFGGKQLTDDIAKTYELSIPEARLAKDQANLPEDYQAKVLDPFKELVSLQLRRALQFFYSTSQYSEVDQILLAGGCCEVPGLAEKVEEVLEIKTCVVNPVADMNIAKGVDADLVKKDAAALMIACGLALRKFE